MSQGINVPWVGKIYASTLRFTSTDIGSFSPFAVMAYGSIHLKTRWVKDYHDAGVGEEVGRWYASGNTGRFSSYGFISGFTYYTITTKNSTGGTVSGGGNFDDGTTCTITAKPNSGYVVTTIDGEALDIKTGSRTQNFTVNSDRTVTATFEKYYRLTFIGASTPNVEPCLVGRVYQIPATIPTKANHVFLGYSTTQERADAGQVDYNPGDNYTRSSEITAGQVIYLYTSWAPIFTVTFDANGGEGAMDDQTFTYRETQPLRKNTFTREGYVFAGWSSTPGGDVQLGDESDGSRITSTPGKVVTAYAVWVRPTIYISNPNTEAGTIALYLGDTLIANEVNGAAYVNTSVTGEYTIVPTPTRLYKGNGITIGDVTSNIFTFNGEAIESEYEWGLKTKHSISLSDNSEASLSFSMDPDEEVDGIPYWASGTSLSVTVTPNAGYLLNGGGVNVNGSLVSSYENKDPSSPYTINLLVSGNTVLTTICEVVKLDFVAQIDEASVAGINSVNVPTGIDYGGSVSFTADINEGYSFWGWYNANGERVSTNATYTIERVTEEMTLTAKAAALVSLTLSDIENSSLVVNDEPNTNYSETVVLGTSITFALTVANGYVLDAWYVNGTDDTRAALGAYGTIIIDAPLAVTARVGTKEQYSRNVTVCAHSSDGRTQLSISDFVVFEEIAVSSTTTSSSIVVRPGVGNLVGGGSGTGNESETFYGTKTVKVTAAATVELDGTTLYFLGWYANTDSATSAYSRTVSTNVLTTEDKNLYVRYGESTETEIFVGLTSDMNTTYGYVWVGDDESKMSDSAMIGSFVTIHAKPKNGYVFEGWYASPTPTVLIPIDGAGADWTFTVIAEAHYYARFVVDTNYICEWEGSSTSKAMEWRSKVYPSNVPFNPAGARVDAQGYVGDGKGTYLELSVEMHSSPDSAPTATATLDNIASQDARRLPRMRRERFMAIDVKANVEVDAVVLATSMGGLAI